MNSKPGGYIQPKIYMLIDYNLQRMETKWLHILGSVRVHAYFKGKYQRKGEMKFIVSSLISIPLEPITKCEDFNERVTVGGFSDIILFSIKSAYGYKSTLEMKKT